MAQILRSLFQQCMQAHSVQNFQILSKNAYFWRSNGYTKGSFTNYVYKKRWIGRYIVTKNVNFYKVESVNEGGYRWSKKPKTCQRSL